MLDDDERTRLEDLALGVVRDDPSTMLVLFHWTGQRVSGRIASCVLAAVIELWSRMTSPLPASTIPT